MSKCQGLFKKEEIIVIDAREMVAELFRQLRVLVEAGYTAGVVIYFIVNIIVILYVRYYFNDESWLYKD